MDLTVKVCHTTCEARNNGNRSNDLLVNILGTVDFSEIISFQVQLYCSAGQVNAGLGRIGTTYWIRHNSFDPLVFSQQCCYFLLPSVRIFIIV